ncbi:MAG: hypothetical protein NUV42_01380 [Candidatus Yonathbacteria bacterium]|nr:hypothetical protein [Candidatus Yonathbacteria bacterium]
MSKTNGKEPVFLAVGHLLAESSPDCPKCGAPPNKHHVKDYDPVWQDGKVMCECGTLVRYYNGG